MTRNKLGRGAAWLWVVGLALGCSGESAVVGGNEGDGAAAGGATSNGASGVKRLVTPIVDGPGRCLPFRLPLDGDGTAACKLFVTSPGGASCACDAPNRASVTDAVRAAVLEETKALQYCDAQSFPACADLCVCEDLEATGDALTQCLQAEESTADGWCYVSPEQGLGTLDGCPTDAQFKLRFTGDARVREDERALLTCSEARGTVAPKLPLGAVCVPSDELSPTFSGFQADEVVVDGGDNGCVSGICLVQGFQGRVSCPLGSPGNGSCKVPASQQAVLVPVVSQLVARPPSLASTCSCRCAGPGPGPFCSCADDQECAELVADLGLPGDQLAGSYCVPRGATEEPTDFTRCGDRCVCASPVTGGGGRTVAKSSSAWMTRCSAVA